MVAQSDILSAVQMASKTVAPWVETKVSVWADPSVLQLADRWAEQLAVHSAVLWEGLKENLMVDRWAARLAVRLVDQ